MSSLNPTKHAILKFVQSQVEYPTLDEIYKGVRTDVLTNSTKVEETLGSMVKDGLLDVEVGDIISYEITDLGLLALNDADAKVSLTTINRELPKSNIPVVPAKLIPVPTDLYNGAELQRTCMRPGAYDAYDKPSLINGVAVYANA